MIAITAAGLVLDYTQRQAQVQERTASLPPVTVPEGEPDISRTAITELLPSARREHKPLLQRGDDRLKSAMSFDLLGDGRLIANGTIRPGTAKVFAAEIAKRGSYVKTVVLHSRGGSVSDAIEMGRLIRQKQLATEVESGRYCASSCPLIFADGVERRAGQSAAIGVHQVTALAASDTAPSRRSTAWIGFNGCPPSVRNIYSKWASIPWSGSMPWRRQRTSYSTSRATSF
jgi:hypothetical protein